MLNYSVRWTFIDRIHLEGSVFPVAPDRATRFRQQSGFGIRASPGIPRQFPWQIHATPFVSWIKFTLFFFRPYSTMPSAPTPSPASFEGKGAKRKRAVSKERNWYRLLFSLFFFLLSCFFLIIYLAKVRTNYPSLIVATHFFPLYSFSGRLLKRIMHDTDAFQNAPGSKVGHQFSITRLRNASKRRGWDGQKSRGIRGREMGK